MLIFMISIVAIIIFFLVLLNQKMDDGIDQKNREIAEKLQNLITLAELPEDHAEYGKTQLGEICNSIISGDITGFYADITITSVASYIIMGSGSTKDEMLSIGVKL